MPALTRIGIIGCGEMGAAHARCIAQIGTATVVAFCDRDENRAHTLLPFAPAAAVYSKPDLLFRDDSIDAVYICTQNESHAAFGIAAAEAGKHVMMEKPVAMSLRECDRLLNSVERSGIRFMTAFKLRFYPAVLRVREFIPSPFLCLAQMIDERWQDSFWGNDPVRGGGNVLSQGCHAADLMSFLVNSVPTTVYARGGNYHHPELTINDSIAATVTYASGATGSMVIADLGRTPFLSKFSFQVMDGVRTAHLHDRLKQAHLWDGVKSSHYADVEELGVLEENKEFLQIVSGKCQPGVSLRDGVLATVLLLRAAESLKTGQPHSVEL